MANLRVFRNIIVFLCITFIGLGHLASQDAPETPELETGVWYGEVSSSGSGAMGDIAFVVDSSGIAYQGGVRLIDLTDENITDPAEACVTRFADLTLESRPVQITNVADGTGEGLVEVTNCFVSGQGYITLTEPWTGVWQAAPSPTEDMAEAVRLFARQPAEAIATGETLYNQKCSACHGVGGIGTPIAPPFVDFVVLPLDYIERRVRSGPDVMSAFTEEDLPGDQLADIVAYVQNELVGTEIRAYTTAELEEGRVLYIEKCAECHGNRGQGSNDFGPPLLIWPPYSVTGIYEGARIPLPEMGRVRVSNDELDLIAGYYVLEMTGDD